VPAIFMKNCYHICTPQSEIKTGFLVMKTGKLSSTYLLD
jgi:hypothetical protein